MQHIIQDDKHKIHKMPMHKNKPKYSEIGPVRQNSIRDLLNCSISCATTWCYTILHNGAVLLI